MGAPGNSMDTRWLLLAHYRGQPLIPAEDVCRDFFAPMTFKVWREKVQSGAIKLTLTRMTDSQKAPVYVAIGHLAEFLDQRMEQCAREARALAS